MNSELLRKARIFLRRHWQGALRWREKLVFKEEAVHLLVAGVVGVLGGLVNLFFFWAGEMVQRTFLAQSGDPVQTAEMLTTTQRLLVPDAGRTGGGLDFVPGFPAGSGRKVPATCWKWWWPAMAGCPSAPNR